MKKNKVIDSSAPFWSITVGDLKEGDVLLFKNGLLIRYIGEVDILQNGQYLFKTIYSPFATTTWMNMTAEKISTLKVFVMPN